MSVIKKETWKNDFVEVHHSSNENEWSIFVRRKDSSDRMLFLTYGEMLALGEILSGFVKEMKNAE